MVGWFGLVIMEWGRGLGDSVRDLTGVTSGGVGGGENSISTPFSGCIARAHTNLHTHTNTLLHTLFTTIL